MGFSLIVGNLDDVLSLHCIACFASTIWYLVQWWGHDQQVEIIFILKLIVDFTFLENFNCFASTIWYFVNWGHDGQVEIILFYILREF